MISVESLIHAGIHPTQAKAFADPLSAACALWGIDTPVRLAAFVAECAHESSGFTALEENLYYTNPARLMEVFPNEIHGSATAAALCRHPQDLANMVYAGRNGNGDQASGDGWRYRGRGLIGLTGRSNYQAASIGCARNWVAFPDQLIDPRDACHCAAWFWTSHKLNALADVSDVRAITKVINPALEGLPERQEWFRSCLEAFSCS